MLTSAAKAMQTTKIRHLATSLIQICDGARDDGDNGALDRFVRVFLDLWAEIPSDKQPGILQQLQKREPRRRLLEGIKRIPAHIDLDSTIQSLIPAWRQDPERFFTPIYPQSRLQRPYEQPFANSDFAFSLFMYVRRVEAEETLAALQRRIGLIGICMLTAVFEDKDCTPELAHHIVKHFHGNEQISLPDVQKCCSNWAQIGRRYCRFIEDFRNPDVIMVVPRAMTTTTLEHYWPIKSSAKDGERSEAIEALRTQGILRAAEKCDGITEIILQFLWVKVRQSAFAASISLAQNPTHGTKKRRTTDQTESSSRKVAAGTRAQRTETISLLNWLGVENRPTVDSQTYTRISAPPRSGVAEAHMSQSQGLISDDPSAPCSENRNWPISSSAARPGLESRHRVEGSILPTNLAHEKDNDKSTTGAHALEYQSSLALVAAPAITKSSPPKPLQLISAQSRDLATLLFLFDQSEIPMDLFARARKPCLFWNHDGEAAERHVSVVEVVREEHVFKQAMLELRLMKATDIVQKGSQQCISINSDVLQQLANGIDQRWKTEAVKIILIAFPSDRRLVPAYSFSIATSLLPPFRTVLPLLAEICVHDALPLSHVIDVCISASFYATLDWKDTFVAAAEKLAASYPPDERIIHRVVLRRMMLSLISSCEWGSNFQRLNVPRSDSRSNGYYGEYVLFLSEVMIGSSGPQAALDVLERYQSWVPGKPSTLERALIYEACVQRGKILHFSGRFKDAKACLEQAVEVNATHQEATTPSKATAHLVAVCLELGDTKFAIRYGSGHLNDIVQIQSYESGNAKRLRLALAYAYLLDIMWAKLVSPDDLLPADSCKHAQRLFEELNKSCLVIQTRAQKTNRVSVLLGQATLAHSRGFLQDALRYYDMTLIAAMECQWKAGYIESVVLLSKSVILHHFGDVDEAMRLASKANLMYSSPSYFFVGFGTLWPEIIGRWFAEQGRERIIPQHDWRNN
ncbi:hypothetical protein F5Y16DRAFT_419143 [Xylariaceae sp. FL0255]|nr:hypothetical protein F5Y16DRAFT_419143 [Xylariaceae sp. FL0255]